LANSTEYYNSDLKDALCDQAGIDPAAIKERIKQFRQNDTSELEKSHAIGMLISLIEEALRRDENIMWKLMKPA
jgi:hypothetical protein